MSEKTYIYALICPETNLVRYVGKTRDVAKRYRQHTKNGATALLLRDWINELRQEEMSPRIAILEVVEGVDSEWQRSTAIGRDAKLRWIYKLSDEGHPLLNNEPAIRAQEEKDQQLLQDALKLGREMFG